MELDVLVTEGSGTRGYIFTWGDEAAVVDPQRDVERFVDAAAPGQPSATSSRPVHSDYVSGALELRAATGAEIWGPAKAGYAFGHRSVEDRTEIPFGDATLLGVATPGHTPEHLAYLLRDGARRMALFSGGSVIVGGAGRTDLLGPERTDELTAAVPLDAAAREPVGRVRVLPNPRGRELLRGRIAGRTADVDDRRGAGDQPLVHGDGRGRLRATTASPA